MSLASILDKNRLPFLSHNQNNLYTKKNKIKLKTNPSQNNSKPLLISASNSTNQLQTFLNPNICQKQQKQQKRIIFRSLRQSLDSNDFQKILPQNIFEKDLIYNKETFKIYEEIQQQKNLLRTKQKFFNYSALYNHKQKLNTSIIIPTSYNNSIIINENHKKTIENPPEQLAKQDNLNQSQNKLEVNISQNLENEENNQSHIQQNENEKESDENIINDQILEDDQVNQVNQDHTLFIKQNIGLKTTYQELYQDLAPLDEVDFNPYFINSQYCSKKSLEYPASTMHHDYKPYKNEQLLMSPKQQCSPQRKQFFPMTTYQSQFINWGETKIQQFERNNERTIIDIGLKGESNYKQSYKIPRWERTESCKRLDSKIFPQISINIEKSKNSLMQN